MATFSSIKRMADDPNLTCIPPSYVFQIEQAAVHLDDVEGGEETIPIIDYSLLTSGTREQRTKIIQDLRYACQEWGFFMVINHGVNEGLMKRMLKSCKEFFHLTEEEKMEFQDKHVLDPIRYGTSFNASVDDIFFWRDYLKVKVHPEFHSPDKPTGFRQVLEEYAKAVRVIVRGLLGGISESLDLDSDCIGRALDIESSLQILTANLYPPCPQPGLAMGFPPHSDHGLLTMLIHNGISGLQIQHRGKWVSVDGLPNAFLVNTGDHMEILSNGKYKSVLHRATVNNKATRISIATSNGPSPEAVVSPVHDLLENGCSPAGYIGMKYKDYLELQQSNKLDGKSCLDRVKV
ncbi:hypothetical protein SAY87_014459 [Trapa incisa]|uniref:Fe2OG dioxygenase domain-containing protein n=1 Tax=Trapa incisa TaxID=236973 RepID=A0AAN7GVN3_9MYRT|nr:hypothetical protein SAY87_014459 [Trapa incisa]